MPRHRTLRAVVAWSWDLLSADEQRLTSGCRCSPRRSPPKARRAWPGPDAGDLLDALVDKSLLQVAGDGRYRMLETIREFGLERLAEAGAVAEARAAHAAYFCASSRPPTRTCARQSSCRGCACSTPTGQHLRRAAVRVRLRRCRHRPAHRGRPAHAVVDQGRLRAVGDAVRPRRRGAGPRTGERPRDRPGDGDAGRGVLGGRPPDDDELAAMLAAVRATDLHASPYVALIEPITTLFTDNTAAGLAAVERGLAHPDPWTRAMLLVMRGQIEENDGDADGMLRDLTAASGLLREIGERWGLAMCLSALADALTKRGDFEAATGVLEESLALSKEINADDDVWYQRMWLAMTRSSRGDVAGARAELAQFVAELTGPRDGRAAAWALYLLGELARCGGDPDEALALYAASQARQDAAPMVAPQFRALVRAGEAYAMLAKGDLAAARRLADEAVRHGIAGRDMPVTATTAVAQAALRVAGGDAVSAAETLGAADSLRGHVDKSNVDAERLAARLREALGDASTRRPTAGAGR
jgi:tetratricopeptide (TPR) repeat protein